VLLVAANFADQKNRIEDESGNDSSKENDAKENSDALTPIEDDPSAAHRECHRRQADAQREKRINGFLAVDDAHREIVAGQGAGVRCWALSEEDFKEPQPVDSTSTLRRELYLWMKKNSGAVCALALDGWCCMYVKMICAPSKT